MSGRLVKHQGGETKINFIRTLNYALPLFHFLSAGVYEETVAEFFFFIIPLLLIICLENKHK